LWGVAEQGGMPQVNCPVCVEVEGAEEARRCRMGGKTADICDVSDWPLPEGKDASVGE
jgi:hypothetical protein